jgi:hypothetical protein
MYVQQLSIMNEQILSHLCLSVPLRFPHVDPSGPVLYAEESWHHFVYEQKKKPKSIRIAVEN